MFNYYHVGDDERYFTRILTLEDVRLSIPELNIGKILPCDLDFNLETTFVLEADMAWSIYSGGAYKSFPGTPKDLAQAFCKGIFGEGFLNSRDRFRDIQVYRTHTPWCSWFFNIAWDVTWIIFDEKLKRLWLICITDTD
jgi:hypothetical protein